MGWAKKLGKYEGPFSVLFTVKFLRCSVFLCYICGNIDQRIGIGGRYKKEDFLKDFSEQKSLIGHGHELGARMSKIQEVEEIIVFRPLCRQLIKCNKALLNISSGCKGFVSGQKTGTFALISLLASEETNIKQAVSRR